MAGENASVDNKQVVCAVDFRIDINNGASTVASIVSSNFGGT